MTPSFWPSLSRRLSPPAVRLTLGVWAFGLAAFSIAVAIAGAGKIQLWVATWLGAITLTGLVFSLALYEVVKRGGGKGHWGWLRLGGAVIVLAAVQSGLDGVVMETIRRAFGETPEPWFVSSNFAYNSVTYLWIFGFYAAALELITQSERANASIRQSAEYAVQVAEARELAREAQVQVLRLQLNPHFLFNTLNGISSLVVSNRPEQAEAMIHRLSRFLRATLTSVDGDLIPLSTELAAVEAYLDIEAVRFPDALDIQIECPPELGDALTPSLILQPLVENALRHAMEPSGGRGSMRIVAQADDHVLTLTVRDRSGGPGAEVLHKGAGMGLDNVRRRLSVIYGDAGELTTAAVDGGFEACIAIPLRRHELRTAA